MAAPDLPARTWLLATTAAWALTAWLLALAGMGAYAPVLPDAPALAAVPTVRPPAKPRLGPPMLYAAITARPLLSEDRQPRPFVIASQTGETAAAPSFDLILTSVLITPGLQMAILQSPDGSQSLRVRVGDAPDTQPSWRLSSLSARSAVFEGPEGQRTLQLRVFDGTGGATPSQPSVAGISAPPAPPMLPSTGNPGPGAVSPGNATGVKSPASFGATSPPAGSSANGADAAPSQPLTEDAQIEAIRKRIEARRAQLRQQAQPPPPSPPVP